VAQLGQVGEGCPYAVLVVEEHAAGARTPEQRVTDRHDGDGRVEQAPVVGRGVDRRDERALDPLGRELLDDAALEFRVGIGVGDRREPSLAAQGPGEQHREVLLPEIPQRAGDPDPSRTARGQRPGDRVDRVAQFVGQFPDALDRRRRAAQPPQRVRGGRQRQACRGGQVLKRPPTGLPRHRPTVTPPGSPYAS
jgi:hypothetical protein